MLYIAIHIDKKKVAGGNYLQQKIVCVCLCFRFVASFSYYGSVLGSSELLEKNLLCVTDADPHTHIKHSQPGAPCYCVPLTQTDYITLLFSCLGEVVCKCLFFLTVMCTHLHTYAKAHSNAYSCTYSIHTHLHTLAHTHIHTHLHTSRI